MRRLKRSSGRCTCAGWSLPRQVDSLVLYELATRAGIAIAPGPIFSPGGGYRNCIRLSATRWGDREEMAIQTLGTRARKLVR